MLAGSNCTDLTCLKSLSTDALVAAANHSFTAGYSSGLYTYGDFFYGPVVDDDTIRDLPSNEFKHGHFTPVPLLTNREGYEGYIFSNQTETTDAELLTDLQELFPSANQSFFDRLLKLYPRDSFNSTLFQRQQIFGDYIISCPTSYMSSAVSHSGNKAYKLISKASTQLHGSLISYLETPTTQRKSLAQHPCPNSSIAAPKPGLWRETDLVY